MPVRRHRPAGMLVRIDQGTERPGAFEPRIEVEPQLAGQRQVGTLAGGHDDPVHGPDLGAGRRRLAFDDARPCLAAQGHDREACDERRSPALHESLVTAPSSPRAGS